MGKTYIQFRCTDGFKADVEQWADNCGLSVSDYVREAVRQKAQQEELHK